MKVSLQVPSFTWSNGAENLGATLAEIARTAEGTGFDSIWVMDHFFQIQGIGEAEEPMLEGYSALSFMAAVTERLRLGTMVTGVQYRTPGFLVKAVTTLDVVSGGRAWLGIGAGWFERESHGLGFPFPPVKERFERLEEALQIAKQAWSGDFSPYDGKHYHLAEPMISPMPISQPHPPIMIGGGGEKKTLRLVAQYGDACNFFAGPGNKDVLVHKLAVLKQHCEDVGRDYDDIEKTVLVPATMGTNDNAIGMIAEYCPQWAEIGIQHVIISNVRNVDKIKPLENFGNELIPAVANL